MTGISATGPSGTKSYTFAWDVSGLANANPVQTSGNLSGQPTSPAPTSPALVTTRPGELVIVAADFPTSVQTVSAAFTEDSVQNTDGWAHSTSADQPPGTFQATWSLSDPGMYCATGAAFVTGP